ncbi:short-chain dehydrogenase/reductase SDR [Parafrankia sp. EAN1pec]|uniref:SDR family NAD(P)-dependent oxidoreductase n=1 Tax=Parafrankia sp. (strain EAN1pec) TaxID=298653 RepID=UPI0000543A2A|nr:short-chain dehydrogenase/reductase SDR [Frankia sp. EAN1pec]
MTGLFEGKTALITGAGSGMGRAITLRLVGQGASVLALDIDADRLVETKALAAKALETEALATEALETARVAGTVSVRQADVSDPGACAEAVAACVAEFGKLDVLGNVAGIYLAEHTTKVTVEQYRRVMGVNLDACFFLAQAAIPHLLETGGNIVNIASNAGLQGVPYSAAYSMSKGGVVALTRSLAVEFLKTPLRVNAIAPAGTNTNIATSGSFPSGMDPDLARRMAGLRGLAEPEEIAALFSFLASADARSVTGAVYTVDNGLTIS